MPQKLNKAGKMQDYIPKGNGDASGEYGTSNGTNKNFTASDKKKSKANVITENKSVVVENKGKETKKDFSNSREIREYYEDKYDELIDKYTKEKDKEKKDEIRKEMEEIQKEWGKAYDELKKNGKKVMYDGKEEITAKTKPNIIDNDLAGSKETTNEKIEKLNTPELKEKFKETLKKAVENARKAEKENNEDGGTANLDSFEIYLKNANLKQLEEMVKSVDPKLRILKWDNGVYHIVGYEKGQGNLNTRMVEAFEKTFNDAGFNTYVYMQMD